MGKMFHKDGTAYIFVGVLWGDFDFYYAFRNFNTGSIELYSCVGSIEGFGFELCKTKYHD